MYHSGKAVKGVILCGGEFESQHVTLCEQHPVGVAYPDNSSQRLRFARCEGSVSRRNTQL